MSSCRHHPFAFLSHPAFIMGKGKLKQRKEYPLPRDSFYLLVVHPLIPSSSRDGVADRDFHDNLGRWLEWLTTKKAEAFFYHKTNNSVIVKFNGNLTDDVANKVLGRHTLSDANRQGHHTDIFEYHYKFFGSPETVQRA